MPFALCQLLYHSYHCEVPAATRRVGSAIDAIANAIAATPSSKEQVEAMSTALTLGIPNLLEAAVCTSPDMPKIEWREHLLNLCIASIRDTIDAAPTAECWELLHVLHRVYTNIPSILLVTRTSLAQAVFFSLINATRNIANAMPATPPEYMQVVALRYRSYSIRIAQDISNGNNAIASPNKPSPITYPVQYLRKHYVGSLSKQNIHNDG